MKNMMDRWEDHYSFFETKGLGCLVVENHSKERTTSS
jgi:hypothetical protein